MEAVGLTVGVIALAGVLKDCIDLFQLVSYARARHKDVDILETKLELEKMLFVQWASRVQMLDPERYDKRLDDPGLSQAIAKVLGQMRALLGESKTLTEQYGLQRETDYTNENALGGNDLIDPSSSRLRQFAQDFEKLTVGDQESRPKPNRHVNARFRWVVKDKNKFEGLIQQLMYFNSRLDALVPTDLGRILAMSLDDLGKLRHEGKLKTIGDVAKGRSDPVAHAAEKALHQARILNLLRFRWIMERYITISEGHMGTLEWALDSYNDSRGGTWDNLSEWLAHGQGIYWVSGKAGSGKSTLMKFLFMPKGEERFQTLVRMWAGDSQLLMCHFFFYHLGRPEQKSQEGLLRSLLYQILDRYPAAIEHVLPESWRESVAVATATSPKLEIPSVAEMRAALATLVDHHLVDHKLMVIIDGLDEFDGRPDDAIALLRVLERNPNIKILVSSRPYSNFCAAFRYSPKMDLATLNRGDIEIYINDHVAQHEYMPMLSIADPNGTRTIIEELTTKAQGVFLWVILACRSIIDGFHAYDDISDLQRRVDELPPELEDLFELILRNIETRWLQDAAKLLRLVFDNQTNPKNPPIPTLGLAQVDERRLQVLDGKANRRILCSDERTRMCRRMEGRLLSRCRGLLEVQQNYEAFCLCFQKLHQPIVDSVVVFMHRSVYEYLCLPGVWQRPVLQIKDSAFESFAILCKLWILLQVLQPSQSVDHFDKIVPFWLYSDLNGCNHQGLTANLLSIQVMLSTTNTLYQDFSQPHNLSKHQPLCEKYGQDLPLNLAAELGMEKLTNFAHNDPKGFSETLFIYNYQDIDHRESSYAESDVADRRSCNSIEGCSKLYQRNRICGIHVKSPHTALPILYHATCKPLIGYNFKMVEAATKTRITDHIQSLFRSGHDPNERFYASHNSSDGITTPWLQWLTRLHSLDLLLTWPDDTCKLNVIAMAITQLFLNHGAEIFEPESTGFRILKSAIALFRNQVRPLGLAGVRLTVMLSDITRAIENQLETKFGTKGVEAFYADFVA